MGGILSSVNNIGPKELYIERKDLGIARDYCSNDDESSIVWFQSLQQSERGEFLNGHSCINNILMLAAEKANITLVKYILEHTTDKQVINMRDDIGRSALYYAVHADASIEKVMTVTQLFIDHGAHLNYCDFRMEELTTIGHEVNDRGFGTSLMGSQVKILETAYRRGTVTVFGEPSDAFVRAKKLATLFAAHKAECYIDHFGKIETDTTEIEKKAETSEERIKVRGYGRVLKEAQDNAHYDAFWTKARFVVLAHNSPESDLVALPKELINEIEKALSEMIKESDAAEKPPH